MLHAAAHFWLLKESSPPPSIDNRAINILDLREISEPINAKWISWENEKIVKKCFTYCIKRTWQLRCIEKDVAWSNSLVKYLQEKMAAGETVTLTIFLRQYHTYPTECHIAGLEHEMEPTGQQNIRKFTVTLKEK